MERMTGNEVREGLRSRMCRDFGAMVGAMAFILRSWEPWESFEQRRNII